MILLFKVHAQVLPKGMNYQAVALSQKGKIISNQPIILKVNLFSFEDNIQKSYFTELHNIKTSEQGLFNLIIGEGAKENGEFGLVPWNTENIWLEISIKEKGQSEFALVSNGKLMAVPYAMHAATANKLSDNSSSQTSSFAPPEPGVISTTWSVFGNAKTDAAGNPFHVNSLGTTDLVDLIMITDNVERLRILTNGNIITKLNFDVGQNLTVDRNLYVVLSSNIGDSLIAKKYVFFNTMAGATINYGPFTVANQSPTHLSGILTVDKATDLNSTLNVDGPTDLNSRLYVNNLSPTLLTGTLQVDSTTNLNDALNVNNMSPSYLSGKLRVDSCATFNDKVKIVSLFSTDTSGLSPSGSLQVGGGTYIKENLFIGGIAKFGGPAVFGGPVKINSITESTSTTTGALVVYGGVGIGLNLNVGAAAMFGKMTTIKNVTESIDTLTGALKVWGGVGIRKNINVGGDVAFRKSLYISGVTTFDSTVTVKSTGSFIAHFRNIYDKNGISIQINNSAPGWANNFVEFRKNTGGVVGRIEGENSSQYMSNVRYQNELELRNFNILYGELLVTSAAIREASAIIYVVAAATSFTVCAGLGVCAAAPIISFIVQAALELASATVTLANNIVGLVAAHDRKNDFLTYTSTHVGVTYESGAGDYAEWLPKANPEETFFPGQIVGLQNGRITKNLENGGKLFVITTNPIVLGNMPAKDKTGLYAKVAFMGQVQVHVLGKVNAGDYIIPSGKNDGFGIAVSPANLQPDDYKRMVGVAWTSSTNESYKTVKVAVGLNDGDINKVVVENNKMLDVLKSNFDKTNSAIAALLPEFKRGVQTPELSNSIIMAPDNKIIKSKNLSSSGFNYREISKERVVELLDEAANSIKKTGVKLEGNPFWDKIQNDPKYKESFIENIQSVYKKEVVSQIERWKPKN